MSDPVCEIVHDLRDALDAAGLFAAVATGDTASTAVPRAVVRLARIERFRPDDEPDGVWLRVIVRIEIHTRELSPSQAQARSAELLSATAEAILADPTRGRRCRDLPIGPATEIDKLRPTDAKRPAAAAELTVRCHARKEES